MTRQTAMKRYLTYTNHSRECCRKPCKVIFEDKEYISFTNSWSLVLTTEDPGDIELFDTNAGRYPDIAELVNFDGIKRKVDFSEIFAEAKSRGYRLGKKEVDHRFKYLLKLSISSKYFKSILSNIQCS